MMLVRVGVLLNPLKQRVPKKDILRDGEEHQRDGIQENPQDIHRIFDRARN